MGLETGTYINDLNKLWPLGKDFGSTADDHLRLIKKTVLNSFPNITGAMNASQAELNYSVGVTSSIQDQLTANGLGMVPVNSIIMFSGTITGLPSNWKVCDGNNGTPNLTDKFILGTVTQGEIGDTGGSADAIVVSHTHTGTTASDGAHTHSLDVAPGAGDVTGSQADAVNGANTTGSGGAHTHTFTTDSTGSSGTNANLPPYYKLAYIMRVS